MHHLFFQSNHYRYTATLKLREQLNTIIQNDHYLACYANPNKVGLAAAERDKDRCKNTNLTNTGRFQDILDFLITQVASINLKTRFSLWRKTPYIHNDKIIPQSVHQHHTEKNQAGQDIMWFSSETWHGINLSNNNILVNGNGNLIVIDSNHIDHKTITEMLFLIKIQLASGEEPIALITRTDKIRAIIKDSLQQKPLKGRNAKRLTSTLLHIEPLYVMQGHATLRQAGDHQKKLILEELHIKAPQASLLTRLKQWLGFTMDLTPALIRSPRIQTLEELANNQPISHTQSSYGINFLYNIINAIKRNPKLKKQNWWLTHLIPESLYTCTAEKTCLQILRQPYYNLIWISAVGICIMGLACQLTIIPSAILMTVITIAIMKITWDAVRLSKQACLTVPQHEITGHAIRYLTPILTSNNNSILPVQNNTTVLGNTP